MERARAELVREKADRDVLSERAAGYQEEIRALHEEVEGCHRLLKLAGEETGKELSQYIASLEARIVVLQEAADKKERQGNTGESAGEDADTVVDALAGQFEEVNKRIFLQAELVALQDRLGDREAELGTVQRQLEEALRGGTAEKAASLEAERDEMTKQMEALVSSMQQDYEVKLRRLEGTGGQESEVRPGESVDVGLQTEFNPGDSVADQRVQFAVAHQRISDEQNWSQTLEVQRLSLVREHQLDLADKVAALQREFEEEISTTAKNAKSKYQARVRDMQDRHEQEKGQLIKLIKKLGESSQHEEDGETDVKVFPEMLSPEQTAAMVKSISGHPLAVSQTVMRASIDSSGTSSGMSSYKEGPSQASNEVSFQSEDLEYRSARNSTEALEASVDVSKQSLDSSMTKSPPHWESQPLGVSPSTGEERNVSTMETPPVHVSKTTPASAKTSRNTASQRKSKTTKLTSPSRRSYGKDISPPSAAPYSSLRKSIDKSPEKVLRPAAVSRTPELSRLNPSSTRKKRGITETGKNKASGVPRRFPLTGM